MNLITLTFVFILALFLWRGYQKGLVNSLAQILSLIAAYPAAIFLTTPLAKFIFANTSFTGMLVYFVAGSAIFFLVSFIVTQIIRRFSLALPHTDKTSKLGGAIIGVAAGVIVGLVAVYAIGLVQLAPQTATPLVLSEETFIESGAKKFVSHAASTAVRFALKDDTASHVTKVFAEDPQTMLGHIQNLSNDGQLKTLLSDREIQGLLNQGDKAALLNDWRVKSLMNNPDMQALLVSSADAKKGKFSQEVAAEKLIEAWRHADAIKNDPEVVAIISDPEFQEQLNSANKIPLMMNPKLKELTDIIFVRSQSR